MTRRQLRRELAARDETITRLQAELAAAQREVRDLKATVGQQHRIEEALRRRAENLRLLCAPAGTPSFYPYATEE